MGPPGQHGRSSNLFNSLGPLVVRLPPDILSPLLDRLTQMTTSQTTDTSVPNTALRVILTSLPHPDPGSGSSREAQTGYAAVSKVLIPRLVGSPVRWRGSEPMKGMLANDPAKGLSSDALDVLIEVVKSFGPVLKETN